MAQEASLQLQAHLAEYQALKQEIQNRSGAQNLLIQVHGAALTIIMGLLASGAVAPWVIFLVPIESSIFGMYFFDHAITITRIGAYIQVKIEPAINTLVSVDALGWESATGDVIKTLPRHYVTYRWLVSLTYAGPMLLGMASAAALISLSLPSVREALTALVGTRTVREIPTFYPGNTVILAALIFALCCVFAFSYLAYSRYAWAYSAARAAQTATRTTKTK